VLHCAVIGENNEILLSLCDIIPKSVLSLQNKEDNTAEELASQKSKNLLAIVNYGERSASLPPIMVLPSIIFVLTPLSESMASSSLPTSGCQLCCLSVLIFPSILPSLASSVSIFYLFNLQ